jgi:RNA polymerase sigma-70 factor (ECF subfamily)
LENSSPLAWHDFLEIYQPLRPELYRYCRDLTHSPCDAEDLAQDTMARAFTTLACTERRPTSPRAWLHRIASNLWIDRTRRAREVLDASPEMGEASLGDPRTTREAAGTLFGSLAPQERAAVVLKDVLDMTLEETAEVLSTTVGAVKAALHRGRGKLVDPAAGDVRAFSREALDIFCHALTTRDLDRLTSLLLESAA